MHRVFSWPATLTLSVLTLSLSAPQVRADSNNQLKGTYAFTLSEYCVHQAGNVQPGFSSGSPMQINNFHILDPGGAITYGGASDGLLVFDGNGGASIQNGRATNIMNSANFLAPGAVPLGFGLGPALPFTCTGTYSVQPGQGPGGQTKVTVPLTCTATLYQPNAFNATKFTSTFVFEGVLPQNPDHLVLTDVADPATPGATVQPVTIFFNNGGTVTQQRICTRATTAVRVSP